MSVALTEKRRSSRSTVAVADHSNADERAKKAKMIRGIAAVFYKASDPQTEYWLWDDIVERLMPGCFDRAIKENQDVRGLYNHEPDHLLGRVSSGTLRLSVSATGLNYEIDQDPADPDHTSVAAKIDRGDLTGSSFAFIARRTVWLEETDADGNRIWVRQIEDVDLYDVGPVTWPAYAATTAGRSQHRSGSSQIPIDVQAVIAERDAWLADRRAAQQAQEDADVALLARRAQVLGA